MTWTLHNTDCLAGLRQLPDSSVQCCVTSPPYWGLRDYGLPPTVWGGDPECAHEWGEWVESHDTREEVVAGKSRTTERFYGAPSRRFNGSHQKHIAGAVCRRCGAWLGCLGLEPTPDLYVEHLVEVFREVRRVLRNDGTLWLNLGDSYAHDKAKARATATGSGKAAYLNGQLNQCRCDLSRTGLKPKNLVGIPWMVAFALQADGWYLRSDIIWHKPNPMPESVTDRPTKAHEYLFLLARAERYYYDAEAIKEEAVSHLRDKRYGPDSQGRDRLHEPWNQQGPYKPHRGFMTLDTTQGRNRRTVWTVATQPFAEAHFAVYPPKLIEPCILAGTSPYACPSCGAPWRRVIDKTGTDSTGWAPTTRSTDKFQPTCGCSGNDGSGRCVVLDPFAGAGTTLLVAEQLGRDTIGFELSPDYCGIIKRRLSAVQQRLAIV